MMTRQEIFNTVRDHLLKQQARCINEDNNCQYRGPNGMRCAIGCLIPDEHYKPELEGWGIAPLVEPRNILPEGKLLLEALTATLGGEPDKDTLLLLYKLQLIHDTENLNDWPAALRDCALQNGLTP